MEHRFEYRRGDMTLCISGERAFVEAMVARYLPTFVSEPIAPGDLEPGAAQDPELVAFSAPSRRPQSLADFLRLKEVTAPADAVLAIVYYLEKYEQRSDLTAAELAAAGIVVGLDSAALTGALAAHCAANLLIESGGRFALSYSGEHAVKYATFTGVTPGAATGA